LFRLSLQKFAGRQRVIGQAAAAEEPGDEPGQGPGAALLADGARLGDEPLKEAEGLSATASMAASTDSQQVAVVVLIDASWSRV